MTLSVTLLSVKERFSIVPMGDGSNIKLTLYKWLTPKGNWIHKRHCSDNRREPAGLFCGGTSAETAASA